MSAPAPPATILIVDDEPNNRKLLEALLRAEGYLTRAAADGAQALAAVAEQAPDVILLDVMMPVMDGYQVAAALKANADTSSIPIIMVTALTDRASRLAGLDAGAEEFLTKPVDRAELSLRVRNLLRLKAYSDFLRDHGKLLEEQVAARTHGLAASELRFRQVAENIRDVFFLREADSGRLLYVSPAFEEIWGRSCESLYQDPKSWVESVHPEDRASTIEQFQSGMRAGNFSLKYRIVRPDGGVRWIKSRGFPVRGSGGNIERIASVAEDTTERALAKQTQRRFATAMDATVDAIYLIDRDSMRFVHVNAAACRMQEQTREELLAQGPARVLGVAQADLQHAFDVLIAGGGGDEPLEMLRPRKDGTQVWVERRRHALRSSEGWTIVTLVRDITERRAAEIRIRRLNRVHAMLSGINTLIVRVRDRDSLFAEACRIAVEVGGFRLAWIGIVDPQSGRIVPAASAGPAQDHVKQLLLAIGDHRAGRGLSGMVISENRAVVANDIAHDPRLLLREEALKQGFRSLVVLPLAVAGKVAGLLGLYSDELDFFDDEEMKLMGELAGDIAFAIDYIDKQDRLEYLAYHDLLTGLANRAMLLEGLAQHLQSAEQARRGLAVYVLDIERFKNINDSSGQAEGDRLLQQIAGWLALAVGEAGLVARLDADRFAVVLTDVAGERELEAWLQGMLAGLVEHPFRLKDMALQVAAKVGFALYPAHGTNAETLFKNAEAALKRAKLSGERCLMYARRMTEAVAGKLTLENQLRQALDHGEFVLHYQPKVNLEGGVLTGAEALIRWNDPRSGLVPPGRFIPVLEETGLIHDVGRWAIAEAIAQHLRWRGAGLPGVRMAVNVSSLQLRNRRFVAEVEQALAPAAGMAGVLELEITESLIMEDVNFAIALLKAIREHQVSVAIDDFGTGFSSLSYLSRLPVDALKIDRSFVLDMMTGPQGLALVSTIITLAHSLRLKVVAEGVETPEQSRLLRLLRCNEQQGFLVSKPVPATEFAERFLAAPAVSGLQGAKTVNLAGL